MGDPDLFVRVAENALTVAEDLRKDYFESTLGIAREMRVALREGSDSYTLREVPRSEQQPCAVAFVDGGLSRIDLGLAVPLIVRAGIFRVKQGEHDLEKRETFDHFPLMLGQLRGGLKANSTYGDVVRLIVELGALVTALEDDRFSDIRLLMLHGPLQFVSGPFFEHWFFPQDYEAMLGKDERSHVQPVLVQLHELVRAVPLTSDRAVCPRHHGPAPSGCMHDGVPSAVHLQAGRREGRAGLRCGRAVIWTQHDQARHPTPALREAGAIRAAARSP